MTYPPLPTSLEEIILINMVLKKIKIKSNKFSFTNIFILSLKLYI